MKKENYYIEKCFDLSKQSTCLRTKIGCLLAKDNQILATGYNGAPDNLVSCVDIGECAKAKRGLNLEDGNCFCRGVHAEIRCITQVELSLLKGATLYSTKQPCYECTKILIQVGVSNVIWASNWGAGEFSDKMRKESSVNFRKAIV